MTPPNSPDNKSATMVYRCLGYTTLTRFQVDTLILSSFDRSFQFSRKEDLDIVPALGVGCSQVMLGLSTKKEPETRTTYDIADRYILDQIHNVVQFPSEASIGVSLRRPDDKWVPCFDTSYSSNVSSTIGAGCCTNVCTPLDSMSKDTGCDINANSSDTCVDEKRFIGGGINANISNSSEFLFVSTVCILFAGLLGYLSTSCSKEVVVVRMLAGILFIIIFFVVLALVL